ncbi:MAG TPA: hypothetical protein VER03_18430 [Bryobacteraceae bacterium]|nr:hypothetical protein [Bryobacteraceae bacterium]
MQPEYFAGVDLGQRRDRTAIAVIEKSTRVAERPDPITWERPKTTVFQVRHLERLPLGTPYTAVVEHVARLARALSHSGACPTTVAIDATGVGLPVVDALRMPGESWRLMPVTIGYADHANYSEGFWRVPKRDLIAGLQLAFDARRFNIASALRDAEVLVEELCSMRANTRPSGAVSLASPGAQHDDLAIALSLAWWAAETRRAGQLGVPNPLL